MNSKYTFLMYMCVILTVLSLNVFAQEENSGALYQQKMNLEADKDVGYGAETSFLTWHGYLNFEFIAQEKNHSNFDNHEFYLSAHALVSQRVSLTAEFEYEHAPEKLILPMQAYADFRAFKFMTFRAGIFFTPLGISRSYNLRGNKNRMVRQVAVIHDIMFENWSEVGLNVFGEFPFGLYYDVAVGNGMPNTMATGDSWFDAATSLQSHTEDNNQNKAVHAKLGYHSENFLNGEINAAVSGVTQKYNPDQTREMKHIAAELRYLHASGFRFQGEFMTRQGNDNPADLEKGISVDAYGWYAQVSKRFYFENTEWIRFIEPVFQADYIDINKHSENNKDRMTYAVGLVYAPEDYYLLKFEYDVVNEVHGAKLDNNTFWASVVLEF